MLRDDDGGVVQINFDPEVAGQVTAVAAKRNDLIADAMKTDTLRSDAQRSNTAIALKLEL